ncbi:MAG: four helix bundle protein [Chitinophagaceae bacterium]|nr:MAG: four helix bundle protein [Chitinophagaceae bacterium]
MPNDKTPGFIPPHGGYRKLITYQKAEIIYDATYHFTRRFFGKYDRTVDQMVQAARSGKQNIAEGSMASATSKETEIKLTNVARASLEELAIDYEDFLRTRGHAIWYKNDRLAVRFRELNRTPDATYSTYQRAFEHEDPAICANAILSLVRIVINLLGRQLSKLEQQFLLEGGLRERMTGARLRQRR